MRARSFEGLLRSRARGALLFQALLLVLFAFFRLSWLADREPVVTGDGHAWTKVAHRPLWSMSFWFGGRPPTMPLFYKLLGDSDPRIVWTQASIGLLAWALLAFVVAEMASGWSSLVAFTLVLALGSTTLVRFWDIVIRSEALGLSFFILCFAATLRSTRSLPAGERPRFGFAWPAVAVVSGALSAFARETNAYLLPLLGLLCLAGAWVTRPERGATERPLAHFWARPVALGLAFTLTWAGCQANTRISGRYAFPLMNVIFKRVLPDRQKLAYFRDVLAMPVSDALLERRSHWASADNRAAFLAPELEDFRSWIRQRGYSDYERYLFANARLTVAEAARSFSGYARFDGAHRRAPEAADGVVDDLFVRGPVHEFPEGNLAFVVGAGLAGVFVRSSRTRVFALATLFCAIATVTQVYICYHGDAMEVMRHGMMVGILLRLAVLFGLFTLLEGCRSLLEWRSRRASTTTSPA